MYTHPHFNDSAFFENEIENSKPNHNLCWFCGFKNKRVNKN